MNDFDKALAAAREATTRYAAESARVHGPQHLNHYADRMAEANIDLFDALDAARGLPYGTVLGRTDGRSSGPLCRARFQPEGPR